METPLATTPGPGTMMFESKTTLGPISTMALLTVLITVGEVFPRKTVPLSHVKRRGFREQKTTKYRYRKQQQWRYLGGYCLRELIRTIQRST